MAAEALPLARFTGMLKPMPVLADTARFRTDDPDVLVSASLACPLCLRSDGVERKAALGGYDPSVECCCPRCDVGWRVYLQPLQALRFSLLDGGENGPA